MSSNTSRGCSSTEALVSIVSHLGGPTIAPDDIEREFDFPAGKKLVEWLADQLRTDEESYANGQDRKMLYQAALEGIALGDEEMQMLKRAKVLPPADCDSDEFTSTRPLGYIAPSSVRARLAYIESESSLLEREAAILKKNIRQAKSAAQKAAQMIKSLKSTLQGADGEIRGHSEQIEELSILADASISASTGEALQLLDAYKPEQATKGDSGDIESHLATLSRLSALRSSIVSHHESQIHSLQTEASLMLKAEDIREEAGRLHQAFCKGLSRRSADGEGKIDVPLARAAQDAVYQEELAGICDSLDSGSSVDVILHDMDVSRLPHEDAADVDLKAEMEKAWNLDQVCILGTRGRILDETLAAFTSRLMPPLTSLHDVLSKEDGHIREVEALVGALGEEIEEVVDNVRRCAETGGLSRGTDIGDVRHEALEIELTELLKTLKDLRHKGAPPLILLDRTDVLAELRSLVERDRALDLEEEEWANRLPGILGNLANAHDPVLSAIYAHSPVNTSPPFMHPPHILSLENEVKTRGEELADVVRKVQKDAETLQGGRTTRKLAAFVEKWGRT